MKYGQQKKINNYKYNRSIIIKSHAGAGHNSFVQCIDNKIEHFTECRSVDIPNGILNRQAMAGALFN